MAARADRVCLGTIVGVQGVRGAVRVRSETAAPEDIGAYGPLTDESGEREFKLSVQGKSKGVVVARIDGVADRDAAEALKGVRLYVGRDKLPPPEEDEFYHADLIGLVAETVEGQELGRVRAIYDFGAGDVLELAGTEGKPLLVPFTKAVVPAVDIPGGRIVIDPPPGLLEPDQPGPEEEK